MDGKLEDLKHRLEEQLWWLRTLCNTAEQYSEMLARMRNTVKTKTTSEGDRSNLKRHANVIGAVDEAVALVNNYATSAMAPADTAPHCCEALREALAFLSSCLEDDRCAHQLPTFWLVVELITLTPLQDLFFAGFKYVRKFWRYSYSDDVAITQPFLNKCCQLLRSGSVEQAGVILEFFLFEIEGQWLSEVDTHDFVPAAWSVLTRVDSGVPDDDLDSYIVSVKCLLSNSGQGPPVDCTQFINDGYLRVICRYLVHSDEYTRLFTLNVVCHLVHENVDIVLETVLPYYQALMVQDENQLLEHIDELPQKAKLRVKHLLDLEPICFSIL